MAKDIAIALNNGSINSAVAAALAAQKYRLILLFADTGAVPAAGIRSAYEQQVAHFKPYREHTLAMPYLASLQTTNVSAAADPRVGGQLPPQLLSLLPLLGAAAAFAGHYQASAIYLGLRVGSNADDLAQATEYVQIINELIQLPCGQNELEIATPLLELESWQVVDVGFQVSAPLDRTWSCAEDGSEPCWACRPCHARESAFQQAGKPDPLRVMKKA